MSQLLIIVPCYNEESRIRLELFKDYFDRPDAIKADILFANDGSSDNTSEKIRSFIAKYNLQDRWYVFDNPKNTGKANVIHNAYHWSKKFIPSRSNPANTIAIDFQKKVPIEADGHTLPTVYDWYAYWDADLATPLFEIPNMFRFRELFYPRKEVVFASRVLRLGSQISRNPLRHYLGRVFATVIDLALNVGSYDSQCGAKLLSRYMAEKAFAEPFLSAWIFDVEIMLRVGEINITEYPLIEWVDVPGSKVKIFKEAFRILKEIFLIKEKYKR
ncbi:MAG: glycosyltransferase [Bdellovibrionaceae bacterium]|nr:glycosyltransferase [Pseudobdellovibrionaceae bacterium]